MAPSIATRIKWKQEPSADFCNSTAVRHRQVHRHNTISKVLSFPGAQRCQLLWNGRSLGPLWLLLESAFLPSWVTRQDIPGKGGELEPKSFWAFDGLCRDGRTCRKEGHVSSTPSTRPLDRSYFELKAMTAEYKGFWAVAAPGTGPHQAGGRIITQGHLSGRKSEMVRIRGSDNKTSHGKNFCWMVEFIIILYFGLLIPLFICSC